MLDTLMVNSQWLDGTGDGTVHRTSSRITSSQRSIQSFQRDFGSVELRSVAHISLPRRVDESVMSMSVVPLGFADHRKEATVKANGMLLYVRMLGKEEFTHKMVSNNKRKEFTALQSTRSTNFQNIEGSNLEGL